MECYRTKLILFSVDCFLKNVQFFFCFVTAVIMFLREKAVFMAEYIVVTNEKIDMKEKV